MDKVGECGLMWSRENTGKERKDVGEGEWVMSSCECLRLVAGCSDAMVKDRRHEDARHRRRAEARHAFDLEFGLRRVYKTFRNESPGNLSSRQSLDDNQWGLTVRTQPSQS
jgi:hypothetical protein